MDDWCDKTAAQILVAAYTDPDARERIADLLKLTWYEAQARSYEEAQRIVKETFEGKR
jgi:hypothetical protein